MNIKERKRGYINMAHDGRVYRPKNKLTIKDFNKKVYCIDLASNWNKETLKRLALSTNIINNRVCFIVYNGDKTIGNFDNIQDALNVYNEL